MRPVGACGGGKPGAFRSGTRARPRPGERACLAVGLAGILAAGACTGDGGTGPVTEGSEIELDVRGLASLDPSTEGTYEVWIVDGAGLIRSAGRPDLSGTAPVAVRARSGRPAYLMLTVEPPGDDDDRPSLMKLLGGPFAADGTADLTVTGYLTPVGIPLEERPGVHVLGSVGDPSSPDGGLWLVDRRVDSTHASFFQTFTPLTKGWAYEGWVVRDRGTPDEVWVSYGQFLPNNLRKARYRDDTGIGPFSGLEDYERAFIARVHYPGDDWLANPHGYPVPGGLALPFDLNGDEAGGEPSRWSHVITIEPRYEPDGIRTEDPWEAVPFVLRPYGNAIGGAPPEEPRTVGFHPDELPSGEARILGSTGGTP